MKIGPALAAGNALVLKPSEHAPLSALRLGDLALQAGLPEGLLGVLPGAAETGQALAAHAGVAMLAFTGSSAAGARVAAAAAPRMARLLLECGGKNPIVVAEDFEDVDAVVQELLAEAFANTGQLCVARSKLIVPRRLQARFVQALDAVLADFSSGDPTHPSTRWGPLAHPDHARGISQGLNATIEHSAPCVVRDGRAPQEGDLACGATLLVAASAQCRSLGHEFFGPVLTVYGYDSTEDAIAAASAGGYGLAATLWTRDIAGARAMSRRLQTGHLVVRAQAAVQSDAMMALPVEPAGASGYGVEFGTAALQSYTRSMAIEYLGGHA